MSTSRGVPASGPARLLAQAARALARGADLDAAAATILTAAAEAVGAQQAAAWIADPDRAELELAAAIGVPADALDALRAAVVDDPDHPVRRSARDRAAVIGSAGTDAGGARPILDAYPLVVSRGGIDQAIGVLSVAWRGERPADPSATGLLEATADILAAAIDRARLASMVAERAEWFERLAHTDPLTGLANLRTLQRVLELELARAGRQGGEVSVAVFDVNDFRRINEEAGHEAGDDVLRSVAAVLGESIRLVDTVARAGADEFVVVAPGSAGPTVARRVADGVAALPEVAGRRVSVSAGVARFPADGTTADALLEAARRALDGARSGGAGR